MLFKSLALAITAVANAVTEIAHNWSIKLLADIGKDKFDAQKQVFNHLDAGADANRRDVDLAEQRLQFCKEQERRCLAAITRTTPLQPAASGGTPAGAGDKDKAG